MTKESRECVYYPVLKVYVSLRAIEHLRSCTFLPSQVPQIHEYINSATTCGDWIPYFFQYGHVPASLSIARRPPRLSSGRPGHCRSVFWVVARHSSFYRGHLFIPFCDFC